jgi:hypothetical protein
MIKRFRDFFLDEDHAQLEIPFVKGGRKPMHVDFLDALEAMSKDVDYTSGKSPEDAIAEAASRADLEKLLDDEAMFGFVMEVLYDLGFEALTDKTRKELKEDHDIDGVDGLTIDDVTNNIGYANFTPEAKEEIKSRFMDFAESAGLGDMLGTVQAAYYAEEDGLIPVWRSMRISSETLKQGHKRNLYSLMTKVFKGVGMYWSWDEKSAYAHWGSWSGKTPLDVLIEARVRTEDVDWDQTLYKSIWNLQDEKELELKPGGLVKIVSVTFTQGDIKSKRDLSFIVPIGSRDSR